MHEVNDPNNITHPWLREVTITGGVSFFGGKEHTRFRLNPDLTCIIGGSMTGKSTFLDGLRVHIGADLPVCESVREQVEARGNLFNNAGTHIALDCPGSNSTASLHQQWPALFFTQNELQRLTQDSTSEEQILAKLISSEKETIENCTKALDEVDQNLSRLATAIENQRNVLQRLNKPIAAENAKIELKKFSAAGLDRLHQIGREHQIWKNEHSCASDLKNEFNILLERLIDLSDVLLLNSFSGDVDISRRQQIIKFLESAISEIDKWTSEIQEIVVSLANSENNLRRQVEHALGKQGISAVKLTEFQELERQASLSISFADALEENRQDWQNHQSLFKEAQVMRRSLISDHRRAFNRVAQWIDEKFEGQICVQRVDHGHSESLKQFLIDLGQRGVTRWWNEASSNFKMSPDVLCDNLESNRLGDIGMTSAVQETFRESMTKRQRRKLMCLRCPDRYVIKYRTDDGSYRSLDELSGGRKVGVLLSLLLETADNRPLVIDQPEDELDNRFLFDTLLPALKRLGGGQWH